MKSSREWALLQFVKYGSFPQIFQCPAPTPSCGQPLALSQHGLHSRGCIYLKKMQMLEAEISHCMALFLLHDKGIGQLNKLL